jgi:hypothetical protein
MQRYSQNFPSARGAAVVANDYAHKTVVIFGGLGDVNPNNTWTWDGHNWTQQTPATQPPLTYYSSAAFDPVLNEVIAWRIWNDHVGVDWQRLGHCADVPCAIAALVDWPGVGRSEPAVADVWRRKQHRPAGWHVQAGETVVARGSTKSSGLRSKICRRSPDLFF